MEKQLPIFQLYATEKFVNTQYLNFCSLQNMETLGQRIKERREELGFSQEKLASLTGMKQQSIQSIEADAVRRPTKLFEIAKALRVHENWILTGNEPKEQESYPIASVVPIVGRTGLGEEIIWLGDGDMSLGEIELPFSINTDGLVALECVGDSMKPRYESGEVVIVREVFKNPAEMIGQEAVVRITDGTYLLKKIRRGYTKGKFNLESYNADMREDQEITKLYEVWMTIKPSRVHKISKM